MNRQCRRRIEREWNKIKVGKVCTKFVVRNGLFTIPYVIFFQAVKVGDDLIGAYNVGIFDFKDGSGYLELITICQFVNSLFRSLGSIPLGFVSEENLEKGEEIIIGFDVEA
jgi:hypothetical protein